MIQRKQNLYLLFTITALVFLTLGADVFVTKVSEKDQFELTSHGNVYGVQKDLVIQEGLEHDTENLLKKATGKAELKATNTGIPTFYFPFYSITIVLTVLAAAVLFSFKNLQRQIKIGRLLFVLNLLLFGAAIYFFYLLKSDTLPGWGKTDIHSYLGMGFYCICIAVAFSFLSNLGIRRDLKLIESINRIR